MKSIVRAATVALVLTPALALGQSSTWNVDPAHSRASFTIRHMVISNVRGDFGKMSGTLTLDEKDITKSSVEAAIDVGSIDTREPKRDEHLKSADFFDATKYPAISFRSTKVEKVGKAGKIGKGGLRVTGDLTIRGVTKQVALDVTGPTAEVKDPYGMIRRGVSATTKIDRKDFGVAWSAVLEGGGAVVGNEVSIELEIELIKK